MTITLTPELEKLVKEGLRAANATAQTLLLAKLYSGWLTKKR